MGDWPAMTIWAPTLLLVVFRVAGLFIAAPLLSDPSLPMQVKGLLALTIGLGVTARMVEPAVLPESWPELVLGIGGEMLVGGVIGFAAQLLFVGIGVGAGQISQQMGISLANVFNPLLEDTTTILDVMMHLTALGVFLAIGGHRLMIGGLLETFDRVPLMGFSPDEPLLGAVVGLLTAAFRLGIKVAAPAVVALFLTSVAMGFIQRTMPQLNILSAGFQIRVLVGLVVMVASITALAPLVEVGWDVISRSLAGLF